MKKLFILIFLIFKPLTAAAYVGPGMGVGTIVVLLGIFGTVLLAIFAIIYYPIKKILKKFTKKKEPSKKIE